MVILTKTLFWRGNPIKLFLSFIGLDGYFFYKLPTYYLVGEWFLGAIILIYLLYPLIVLLNKKRFILPIVLIVGYIIQYSTNWFTIHHTQNLITCLGSFYLGMLCVQYRMIIFEKIQTGIIAALLFFIILFLDFNATLKAQILGLSLFVCLVVSGELLLKNRILNMTIGFISEISFYIFLLQHQVILHILQVYNPSNMTTALPLLCAIIILTVLSASFLRGVVNFIHESKGMKFLDDEFLAKK